MKNRPTPPNATESAAIADTLAREDSLCFTSRNTPAETAELLVIARGLARRMEAAAEAGKWSGVAELARRLSYVTVRIRSDSQRHFAECGE